MLSAIFEVANHFAMRLSVFMLLQASLGVRIDGGVRVVQHL
jgi:hypothetical protein